MRKALIVLGYILAAAVVVFGTIILVAVGKGYSYDPLKGRFTYRGLLIVGSTPSGANIKVNDRLIRHRTPYRATMEAKDYSLTVTKDGYRPWNKQVTITASEVYFAQYIFLFPTKIKQQTVVTHADISSLVASHDRRHFAYLTGGTDPGVWLLELTGKTGIKIYTPKAGEQLTEISWSDDGSHLLIRSRLDNRDIYNLTAATGNATPTNLTDLFKLEFANLRFSPDNWRELYWLGADGLLRKIDASAQTSSAVLADKVVSFTLANDRAYYVATTTTGKSLFSLERGGRKTELAQSLPESSSYELAYSGFGGQERIAVLPVSTRVLSLHSGFDTPTPTALVVAKLAEHAVFSPDGRFLAFYNANGQASGIYDLEKAKLHSFNAISGGISQLSWFDEFHLLLNANSQASVVEFDGGNLTSLVALSPSSSVWNTSDWRLLISITNPGKADSAITTAEIR